MIVVSFSGIQNPAYRLAAFFTQPLKGSVNAQAFMKRKMHAEQKKKFTKGPENCVTALLTLKIFYGVI
jgi:hypothetical protein